MKMKNPNKKRLSKGFRKYIRKQKAEIKRSVSNPEKRERKLKELDEFIAKLLELKQKS